MSALSSYHDCLLREHPNNLFIIFRFNCNRGCRDIVIIFFLISGMILPFLSAEEQCFPGRMAI